MENWLNLFIAQAEKTYSDEDRDKLGIGAKEAHNKFVDDHIVELASQRNMQLLSEDQTNSLKRVKAQGRLDFVFEDKDDAYDLYSFMTGHDLLSVGEIELTEGKKDTTVSFAREVVESKGEMVRAAMLAFEEKLDLDDEESVDVLESVVSGLANVLDEAATTGAPKKSNGNPFHNRKTGKFSSSRDHISSKGGSWASGKTKLKFTGKAKSKTGGVMARYGSTKHPCGRAARAQGKDIRCWDGNKGLGLAARVSRIMKGKKKRGSATESIDIANLALLMEVRAIYKNR